MNKTLKPVWVKCSLCGAIRDYAHKLSRVWRSGQTYLECRKCKEATQHVDLEPADVLLRAARRKR